MASNKQRNILVINPNTTLAMTDGLRPLVNSLGYETTSFDFFTAPSGVPSINNEDDAAVSTEACLPTLVSRLDDYSAFLICCFSEHPLVPALRREIKQRKLGGKLVAGIFEASVATCLQSIDTEEKFGIVSTGKQWEEILAEAVASYLGHRQATRFAGTETTGLNADELHTAPKAEVDSRMKEATKRVLMSGAKAICLGCAGMAGMDTTVREACVEHLGEKDGSMIKIVDGVVSGSIFLEGALRAL